MSAQETTPRLRVRYCVTAYNASYGGYGEDASRDFGSEEEAVSYARSLPSYLSPSVHKRITMDPITVPVEWREASNA